MLSFLSQAELYRQLDVGNPLRSTKVNKNSSLGLKYHGFVIIRDVRETSKSRVGNLMAYGTNTGCGIAGVACTFNQLVLIRINLLKFSLCTVFMNCEGA